MGMLFMALLAFFAVRALTYFVRGRLFAGLFASAACLLFVGALYADYAGHHKSGTQAAKRAV